MDSTKPGRRNSGSSGQQGPRAASIRGRATHNTRASRGKSDAVDIQSHDGFVGDLSEFKLHPDFDSDISGNFI